jgi:hypothetical protein
LEELYEKALKYKKVLPPVSSLLRVAFCAEAPQEQEAMAAKLKPPECAPALFFSVFIIFRHDSIHNVRRRGG